MTSVQSCRPVWQEETVHTFYTVDRIGSLKPETVLVLQRFDDIDPPELQAHVNGMFPNGVSSHGNQYFLSNTSLASLASPNMEILLEYVRRACYSTCPSRFQSYFGFQTIDDAITFRARFGEPQNSIWQVACRDYFKADMHLLNMQGSILQYSYWAHLYWKGQPGSSPFWELLLAPPVKVVAQIM